jgi:hypothetical protein
MEAVEDPVEDMRPVLRDKVDVHYLVEHLSRVGLRKWHVRFGKRKVEMKLLISNHDNAIVSFGS